MSKTRALGIIPIMFVSGLFIACSSPQMFTMFEPIDAAEDVHLRSQLAKYLIENAYGHPVQVLSDTAEAAPIVFREGKVDFSFVPVTTEKTKAGMEIISKKNEQFTVSAKKDFNDNFPEVMKLLEQIKITEDQFDDVTGWKAAAKAGWEASAMYFLQSNKVVWDKWFSIGDSQHVGSALNARIKELSTAGINFDL